MVKIICLVICFISAFCGSSTSHNIKCRYDVGGRYTVLGDIYRCVVINNPNMKTEKSAKLRGINGTHLSSKSNDDVLGFHTEYKIIKVFPKGLDKFFKNLKVIYIYDCKLKEIHQSDLKPFQNLVFFFSAYNGIEVIDAGLFDFNPNLEVIGFHEHKVKHIDPNVFDHLNKLKYFWFFEVPCVQKYIWNSTEQVQKAIQKVKSKCSLSHDNQISSIATDSETLSSEVN